MNRLCVILLALFSLTCRRDNVLVDAGSEPTIIVEVKNLMPLSPGAGHYEAWISFSSSGISKASGVQHSESSFVSIGKFNIGANGQLQDPAGKPFSPRLTKARNLQYMSDAIITIEADVETASVHGPVIIGGLITGDIRTAHADLSTAYQDAFGTDFTDATGHFILDCPTSADTADSASGIWFMNSRAPRSAGLLNLPRLPEGWKYEGWLRRSTLSPVNNPMYAYIPTGKFVSSYGFDSDSAGVQKGPSGDGYPFPGEDFAGIKRIILNNGAYDAMITIEPDPDNSPGPFENLILFGPTSITTTVSPGQPRQMQNNAPSFPTASMIKLPTIGRADKAPIKPVFIEVQKDERIQIRVNSQATPSTLGSVADDIVKREPDVKKADKADAVPVVISADKSIKYETVVKVMDALQKAGVTRVGLSVQTGK